MYQHYNASSAYVAISDADRHPSLDYLATIHHGIDTDAFALAAGAGSVPALLRADPSGQGDGRGDRGRRALGLPLVIAGIVQDQRYFDELVAPRIDGEKVRSSVRSGPAERSDLLGGAQALLHLIGFDEPFGYSVVEAMACGTPVIAFNRGSMPELIEDGVTGFLVDDVDGAVAAVGASAAARPGGIRAHAVARFGGARMVDAYVDAYERLLA